MSVPESKRTVGQDEATYVLQIYPRLSYKTTPCCTLQVRKDANVASVIQNAGVTLGLDMTKRYELVEVRECGEEEWILRPSDPPVERMLLWPRKVQDRHPQSHGYYFALQVSKCERLNQDSCSRNGQGERECQGLATRGFLVPRPEDCNDLCCLPSLTETSLLDTLRRRFHNNQIYTYAGDILIAINPFRFLPIYNPKYVEMYENHTLGRLEPHIFAIADAAFRSMLNKRLNQCIVISGESGSGKTQSTNFLIHCLTAFSQKGYTSGVERTILGAGPVLEAFGNAKTAYNNNSSRFGKFIQVNFLEGGVVRGATIEKYLLEKCRLVSRKSSERNYHVFYYLLVGASDEEKEEFQLLEPEDYHYLKQENPQLEDQAEIKYEFKRLHQAMEMVGFLPPTKKQIFSVLSAIMHLGNVTYEPKVDGEGLTVGPVSVLSTLSQLLKVKEELLVMALTKRKAMTANDVLILPYTLSEAITARDSMAKSLYSFLFDWIVLRINHALLNKRDMEDSVPCLSIGVLDIFGFEDFKTNSFEQFCINYANEQLQHYCNQHIFRLEQEEYQSEGISWNTVDYSDNVGCINLISRKPTGLLYLLDEESSLPHATDVTLLEKFKQQHHDNPFFVPTPVLEPAFIIHHYAGNVKYQMKDFRAKNTDHMRPDIVALLRSSESGFLRQLIGSDPVAVFRWGVLRATVRTLAAFKEAGHRWATEHPNSIRRYSRKSFGEMRRPSSVADRLMSQSSLIQFSFDRSEENPLEVFEDIFATFESKKKNRANRHKQLIPKNLINSRSLKLIVDLNLHNRDSRALLYLHKKKKPPSISAQFQTSLVKLLDTLKKAEPFFVRCIRSNTEKMEMHFDEALVLRQLKYTGMLEMVRIKRSGYGAKYTFKEFTDEFRVLLPKKPNKPQEDIANLLRKNGLDETSFQIGHTKVFLKEVERQKLQDTLHREVMRRILTLQRWFRACLARKHYLMRRKAIIRLQRSWRGYRDSTRFRAAAVIQKAWRDSHQRAEYLHQRDSIKKLQQLKQSSERRRLMNKVENRNAVIEERKREISPPSGKPKPLPSIPDQTPSPQNENGEQVKKQSQVNTSKVSNASPSGPVATLDGQDQLSLRHTLEKGALEKKPEVPLARPVSLPLDDRQRLGQDVGSQGAPLQRYSKPATMKDKAVRWKERRSELPIVDRSSYENQKLKSLKSRGISMSLDNLSKFSSSESDSTSPSTAELPIEMDGNKESSMKRASEVPPQTNPQKTTFFGKYFQRKRLTPQDGSTTMAKTLAVREEQGRMTVPYYQNLSSASTLPNRKRRNPSIQISRATRVQEQWNASLDREITDARELRLLDDFLANQITDLQSRTKVLSETETIFLTATTQFRETIKSMYSLSKPQISYKGLLQGYKNKVSSLAAQKKRAEVPLVVNLFQSVLDGFVRAEIKKASFEFEHPKPVKKIKASRENDKSLDSPLDHSFNTYQVTIVQSCDLCGSFIWGMEKACMCSSCKMVCHRKCLSKIVQFCPKQVYRKTEMGKATVHFGVHVRALTGSDTPVPVVLEIMLAHVEMNGLYTEGIYRKSGSACKAKELHNLLETDPKTTYLENYPIHTVAGLIKCWLRELPEPLMTFRLYNDFLYAADLPEKSERLRAIYRKLEELPCQNYNTLERLIFHLVRVTKEESHNRMSANALAIVFAPCILRCPDSSDPLLSVRDLSRTTMCLEIVIMEQTRRYEEKMREIQQLEHAEALAVKQLKLRRQNTILENPKDKSNVGSMTGAFLEEDKTLIERIRSIKHVKDKLTYTLNELNEDASDNENLDTESSVSTESPVEEQNASLVSEGQKAASLPRQGLNGAEKRKTLTQVPTLAGRTHTEDENQNRLSQDGESQSVSSLLFTSSPVHQDSRPKAIGRLMDLDIPFIDEDDP